MSYPRIASLKTAAAFRAHLERSGIALGFDEQLAPPAASPLAQPIEIGSVRVGNRFCILPMEGWDGTREGEPSELTRRRWRHFGISGAKLMWGGEAVAVRHDGRANSNQLMLTRKTGRAIASLRGELVASHRERFGSNADADLFIGLQLTHSGRFARPDAYERLVTRLLDSPHFGEKWARYWLDLARYADSDGYEKDRSRPWAWRYRQWVIEALNRDLPFDEFTREQLAADLMPATISTCWSRRDSIAITS